MSVPVALVDRVDDTERRREASHIPMMSRSFLEKTMWSFPADATSDCVVVPYDGPADERAAVSPQSSGRAKKRPSEP